MQKILSSILVIFVLSFVSPFVLLSCTAEPEHLPDEAKYEENTKMMVNICGKFAEETDVVKLHTAALATQRLRVVACDDYNNECSLYGQYLTLLIDVSKDGSIAPKDRVLLREKLTQLKTAVELGKKKLHSEWQKRK